MQGENGELRSLLPRQAMSLLECPARPFAFLVARFVSSSEYWGATTKLKREESANENNPVLFNGGFKTIVACIVMAAASYAQEPRLVEANAQVGLVSGIGTHGSFGGGIGVGVDARVF